LGDNNYQDGTTALIDFNIGQFYHDYIYPYLGTNGAGASSNRFFPCLGNHDYFTTNAQPYIDYFTLPGNERYYTFQYGPIDFFVLDSNPEQAAGITNGSVQATWLQAGLAASTNAWKVVYFHHAPYSSGLYYPGHPQLRWPFAQWGASAVLVAHDHIYERVHQENMLYLVNGLGGVSRYQLNNTPVAGSQVRYNAVNGAMRIEATDTNLVFSFFNKTNVLIDTVTLDNPFGVPGFVTVPQDRTTLLGRNVTLDSYAVGSSLSYQWFLNGAVIPDATNRSLILTNLTFEKGGVYSITASNLHGTATRSATVAILRHPLIVQHPTNTTALSGSTVTFRVQADSSGPLRYQWQYNGADVPDATNSTYAISNVQTSNEGLYRVAVTDDLGTILSSNATLRILIAPFFVVRPIDHAVIAGQTAVLSYAPGGDFPITVITRQGSQPSETNVFSESQVRFITVTNVPASPATVSVSFVLTNRAARISLLARISAVPDTDGDGAGDTWEQLNGFSFLDPADGVLDTDNDGAINRDEFVAETNPNDTNDVWRLQFSMVSAGEAAFQFNALPSRTYALQSRGDLTSAWTNIAEFWATTNSRVIQITNTIDPTNRFYRVVTPRLP
jgi:hypothetical protein